MNDNLHTIFSASGCPAHKELRDYAEGRLTGDEKHRIEAHLTDCEMCSEEVEGLGLLQDPENLPAIVEELDQRIAAHGHRTIRLTSRRIMAAAAAILLLVGAVFVLRYTVWKPQDTLISEQTVPEEDVKEVDLLRSESESEALIVREISADSPEPTIEEEIPAEAAKPVPEPAAATEGVSVKDAADRGEDAAIGGIAKDSESTVRYGVDGATTKALSGQARSSRAKRVSAPSTMKQAMARYEGKEYREASTLFEQVLKQDSTNYRAIYHLALCYVEQKKVKKAEQELEKILADPSNAYYREAKSLKEKLTGKKEAER